MGKTADLTVVQKTIIDTLHKEGKTQTFITKEAVHRVLYPSMLTESWVEEKDAQPTERTAALWGLSSKIIATASAPAYFHSLMAMYIPSRSLRSASERRLVVPSQRGSKSLSRTFSFTVPDGGMTFLPLYRMLDPCQPSSNTTWLHPLYLLFFLLACTYLNNAWNLVLRALPLSVCLSKMNRFMYSPIVSRFG